MKAGIQLAVVYTDEHLLELQVWASNRLFTGQVDVYADHEAVSQFADQLRGFPQTTSHVCEFMFGSFDETHAGGGVGLRFYYLDSVGHGIVEVRLRSDPERSFGASDESSFHIFIEAAGVDIFVSELEQMTQVIGQVAWLASAT